MDLFPDRCKCVLSAVDQTTFIGESDCPVHGHPWSEDDSANL